MKSKLLFLPFFLLVAMQVVAQTKWISHKSHSGSDENFKTALEQELFDINNSNFGIAPQPFITVSSLDSVIFVSDSVSIIVTSMSIKKVDEYESRQEERTYSRDLWSPGRDTVVNHPVFSMKNSVAEIKEILEKEYHFVNPIDSIKFLRMVKGSYAPVNDEKGSIVPVINGNGNGNTPGNPFLTPIFVVIVLSLGTGWYAYRYRAELV